MRKATSIISASTLIAAAGLTATPAFGVQVDRDAQQPTLQQTLEARQDQRATSLQFAAGSDIIGRSVVNPNGEDLGEISDLVVDRGSGEIKSIILKSGGILGIGGSSVALPAGSFKWNHHEEHAVLDMTSEQIERLPQFDADEFESDEPTFLEEIWQSIFGDDDSQPKPTFDHRVNTDEQREVRGTVTEVRRENLDGTEFVQIKIDTGNGPADVLLGPSWYIMSQTAAPMRGVEATVQACPGQTAKPGDALIATSAEFDGNRLPLRHSDGSPAWHWSSAADSSDVERRPNQGARQLMLLSDISGADAECRGEPAGVLNETVIECRSNRIAFAAIDPEDSFLGIGATNRLVPWTIVSFGADNVARIDASKEMVEASNVMPDDVRTLGTGEVYRMVYRAYGVQAPEFEARTEDWRESGQDAAMMWDENGKICKAAADGQVERIVGHVVAVDRNARIGNAEPAYAILLNTEAGNRERAFFGPAWYFENQELSYPAGSRVAIDARRAEIDGNPVLIIWAIEHNGETTRLWDGNRPVWSNR